MTDSRPEKRDNPSVPNNWVELKEYVEVRFAELVRHYDFRFNALDSLRNKQAEDFDKRLTAMDEVQRTKYPTREDISQIMDRFNADIRILRESRAAQEGKASIGSFYVTLVIALLGLSVAVFATLWK